MTNNIKDDVDKNNLYASNMLLDTINHKENSIPLALVEKEPSKDIIKSLIFLLKNNNLDLMISQTKALKVKFPNFYYLYFLLGLAESQKLNQLNAISEFKKSLMLNSKFFDSFFEMGNCYRKIGNYENAISSYEEAKALNPKNTKVYNNIGFTLLELEKKKEAITYFERAIELNPYYILAYNNLGETLKELGQLNESLTIFKKGLEKNYFSYELHNNYGTVLQELGRLKEAETCYKQAIILKPNFPEALMNLSIVQDYLNNLDLATIQLKNLLLIDPENYGLRAAVIIAIYKFLEDDFSTSKKYLLESSHIEKQLTLKFKNERIYHQYLFKLLSRHENKHFKNLNVITQKNIYVIGESHALVSHGLHVKKSRDTFLCKSMLIQGCMQWHLGNSIQNKFKVKFESIIKSLSNQSDVLLTIGEIDCRLDNGIIKHKSKFPEKNMTELITNTIENYLNYIHKINSYYKHKIIIQGVPSPNVETKNISKQKIMELIYLIRDFNIILKKKSAELGFGFLDVYKITNRGDGFSNKIWHLDATHLSPEGILEAWRIHSS